ncbi:S8 family serine peptidase [Streptomyces sp. NPDC048639]|uniref:S8 family peptidase n=1 Tax=Streptomyces sp. NPDC048639 TaxID=3365581 RepID=UPI003721756B
MVHKQLKRAGATTIAMAAAIALTAGMTTSPSVAGEQAAAAQPSLSTTMKGGPAKHWVTLLTGDRVAVDAHGRPMALDRAQGREHIPVQIQRTRATSGAGGDGRTHTYVVPWDARELIRTGRVDQRLFDVSLLSRPEYRKAHGDGLRLIVGYRGARPAAKAGLRSARGTDVRRSFPRLNAEALKAGRQSAPAVWEALTKAPRGAAPFRTAASGLDRVWLDAVHRASLDKSVPQIGAPAAWKKGFDGKGTTIAVLDTGVDQTHPDLAGQETAERNFSDAADSKDRYGHGTHVASISAGTGAKSSGKYKGVAPGARLLDGKVLNDEGSGEDSGIIAGLEWAAEQGADIVNLSLGGADSPGTDPLEETVDRLSAEKGTLFVIAAGNDGEAGPGSVGSPGSADSALTVGAVDKRDKLADFSSTGPRVGDGAVKPDLTAPGVDIGAAAAPGSTIAEEGTPVADGYVAISGTSMATPHVAGAAAILAQQHPDWSGAQLKAALTASTKPGKYTPFEQGSGRVDVTRAIEQSVVADPVSVSFGTQAWPHTDDKPVTKAVTYRNLGSEPVTLDLAVKGAGPDGKPAPAAMFALGAQRITVRPQGEAEVPLTADTRPGGTLDGAYTAVITATGGGQTVRTTAAVDREVESYDLTLKTLGRDGKPTGLYGTNLDGVGGLASGKSFEPHDGSGSVKIRVPKGRYILNASVLVDEDDMTKGIDWINQPRLDLTKKTTVTVDARTAKPVDIRVPDGAAKPKTAAPDFYVETDDAVYDYGWWLDSYEGFRTAHLGPEPAAGELFQQWTGSWTKGSSQYDLAYGGRVNKLATGWTKHVKKAELATVTSRLGASVPGRKGRLWAFGYIPGSTSGSGYSGAFRLPGTKTSYVNAAGVDWAFDFEQEGEDPWEPDATYSLDAKRYKAGKRYEKVFNVGVFGPKVRGGYGIFRDGNELFGYLPVFADGKGHVGGSKYDKAVTTLYRNGKKVGTNDDPVTGEVFTVPAAKADYRLTTTVTRSKVASVTTKLTASWTFSSKKVGEETALPAYAVRFSPALAADSTAKAGATARVPVSVEGPGGAGTIRSLTVYASYDGGEHWKKAKVSQGKVTLKNPAAGQGVSLRALVEDGKGNTLTQTLHNAYRGR